MKASVINIGKTNSKNLGIDMRVDVNKGNSIDNNPYAEKEIGKNLNDLKTKPKPKTEATNSKKTTYPPSNNEPLTSAFIVPQKLIPGIDNCLCQ